MYHWNEETKLGQKRRLLKPNYMISTKDPTTHLQIIEQGPEKNMQASSNFYI